MQNTLTQTLPTYSGSRIINVKNHGAKGDGVTDDTLAIQSAIKSVTRNNSNQVFIYFPVGTYIISDSIKWLDNLGNWYPYLSIQGESLNQSIIKLKNSTSGFTDPLIRKAMLITGSQNPHTDGGGNEGFRNSIYNLTVDTGVGNLGAVGIDYVANNKGSIRNVTVKGQGRYGIDMSREWPGPCYLKDISITGFDFAIVVNNHYQYGITLENITLANQLKAGIYNKNNILSIRNLVSTNNVPAIQNVSGNGVITLVEAKLNGGTTSHCAIDNLGHLYARNISTTGYQSALKHKGTIVAGLTINEYSSSSFKTLFNRTTNSLKLPIADAPEFYEVYTNWANVKVSGAIEDDNSDDTPEIQAALDSGKSTIYLPSGVYNINKTLYVRGNVKRIVGMESFIKPRATYTMPEPAIVFESTTNDVIVEKLNIRGTWLHTSSKALALIDCAYGNYKAMPGAGNLFAENAMIGVWRFVPGQNIWIRQLNTEFTNTTRLINDGAKLWILGIKTEDPYTVIETKNGGQTELIGGLLYPGHGDPVPTTDIAFINSNSQVSLIYTTAVDSAGQDYTIHAQTTLNSSTKTLLESSLSTRGNGSVVFYCD